MIIVKTYPEFNFRRYSDPWVTAVNSAGRLDFSTRVGAYSGRRGSGEAGQLYITTPKEGQIYAYGQKDYRGNHTAREYVQYLDGQLVPVPPTELVQALTKMAELA